MSLWQVLDISDRTKKWSVIFLTYSGGSSEEFWFKRNALKCANRYRDSAYWIDLKNNITGKEVRINDPQAKQKDPNCKHEWKTRSQASWWCSKCNAQFNLACEHNGSIACPVCIDKLIKENKPFNNYLAEYSW